MVPSPGANVLEFILGLLLRKWLYIRIWERKTQSGPMRNSIVKLQACWGMMDRPFRASESWGSHFLKIQQEIDSKQQKEVQGIMELAWSSCLERCGSWSFQVRVCGFWGTMCLSIPEKLSHSLG
ncbi:uncharacterized protein LOC433632 [Mus musculus]|jgi:hypothetical protein|uniref:Predicted gene, EG433632 n=1 Tax=Mus musculus TaxID=10090 RepID=Q3UQK6_MOUSE|nr:uncharacterized protein LOC433632 [Mus musculus]AAI47113.1 Predicted gene, EG433632 [Mus musculus]AAI47114.1 Predicted gene, EG433632 [Mus musculus]BAE25033.1 unnamed protein product [Mus musculus]|eukprot:NP_001028951.1 uncharacterized protein LOC433632 [Mus musculus]